MLIGKPSQLKNDSTPSNFFAINTTIMKINFPKDFREFVELLEKHKIEYLIVGGYAVGFHGYPRFTGDLDIWIRISETNSTNMLLVVKEFGFGSLGLTIKDFSTNGNIVQLGYPPLRIDLLTEIDGITFDEAYPNKQEVLQDGFKYNFISYDDLLKNKKASGRHKDLDDLDYFNKA